MRRQELYDRPNNLFVAGFIGSPSMNFFPGQLTADGVSTPIGDVRLPAAAQSKISGQRFGQGRGGRYQTEHFEDVALVDAAQKPHGGTFTVDVDVLESMGSDKYAYFLAGGPAVNSRELEELAADSGTAVAGGGQLVARLSSRVHGGPGQVCRSLVRSRQDRSVRRRYGSQSAAVTFTRAR